MSTDISQEITVSFSTKLPSKFELPSDPIVIPTSMDTVSLSKMVCSMLENMERKFTFLIDDSILRGSIQSFIDSRNISTEEILNIEYFFGVEKDDDENIHEHKDWISCILVKSGKILSGSYDGNIRIYPGEKSIFIDKSGITSIDVSCDGIVAVSTKNGIVHFLESLETNIIFRSELVIQNSSIECVKFSSDGSILACGAFTGAISILNAPSPSASKISSSSIPTVIEAKKRTRAELKNEDDEESESLMRSILNGHSKPIHALKWTSSGDLFSASEDQTVRVWDLPSASELSIFPVTAPVMTMDISKNGLFVATGHDDGKLRIWDLKKTNGVPSLILKRVFTAHKRMIKEVCFHVSNPHIVASVALDGAVRVFDVRAESLPVHVIYLPAENNWRGLAAKWVEENKLSSGGSDGILRVHGLRGLEKL